MCRSFALGNRAVVTTDTTAEHRGVIEVHGGPESDGVVAGRTIIGARDVRRRFRCRIELRAGDMARAATAWRSLEDRV